ncbi:MAG: ABC transporter permease [Microthrixaceae bacterium]|nr:ABC transporter permease [Microthrixaceae bacterium]
MSRTARALRTTSPAIVIVAAQLALWPVSAGVWVSGLILGALAALVALGMALIYRASHAVSFAQADLGVLPATLAVLVTSTEVWSWPYWLALPAGLVVAVVVSGAMEMLLLRRFAKSPRVVVTIASVGVAQLLGFVALVAPRWWGLVPTIRRVEEPFEISFSVGAVVFGANDLIAAVAAPATMVALGWFLSRTEWGTAIRAAAVAPDRAAMLGVPVRRLQTFVWAISGAMAFLSVFLTAGITGLPPGTTFTFTLLVRALTALVIGRMTHLARIATSAVALGILQTAMTRNNDEAWVAPLLVVVVLVVLLARRRGHNRVERAEGTGAHVARHDHPLPVMLARRPEVRAARAAVGLGVAIVALGAPWVMGTAGTLKAGLVLIYALIGLSVVVLSGWAGQVSLGQMAFVGAGGALTAWATVDRGWDPVISLTAAAALGAVVAVAVGIPALRLRGMNLAIVTLSMSVAASELVFVGAQWRWIPTGAFMRPAVFGRVRIDSPVRLYHLALLMLCVGVLMVRGLRIGRMGRVLIAVRDNEAAAAAYGIGVTTAKLTAFACSGSIAALGGSLLVFHQAAFISDQYTPESSMSVFTASVIGGLGTPLGAVLGAIYLRGAEWVLPGDWHLLATAAGVLLVLAMVPDGLGGAWFRARDHILARIARRRGIDAPGLVGVVVAVETDGEAVP